MTASPPKPGKPLLCRLNLHHKWVSEHVAGEGFARRCATCGKDDPGGYLERPTDFIGGGIGGGG